MLKTLAVTTGFALCVCVLQLSATFAADTISLRNDAIVLNSCTFDGATETLLIKDIGGQMLVPSQTLYDTAHHRITIDLAHTQAYPALKMLNVMGDAWLKRVSFVSPTPDTLRIEVALANPAKIPAFSLTPISGGLQLTFPNTPPSPPAPARSRFPFKHVMGNTSASPDAIPLRPSVVSPVSP